MKLIRGGAPVNTTPGATELLGRASSAPGIYKFGDVSANIIMQCSLKSDAELTAAGGAKNGGTEVLGRYGLDTGTAGGVNFQGLARHLELADSFQISITVMRKSVAEYDDSDSISGSQGDNRIATGYVACWERQDGTNEGRLFVNTSEQINYRTAVADTEIKTKITTVGQSENAVLTMAGNATSMTLYVDGAPVLSDARAPGWAEDLFYALWIGSNFGGAGAFFGEGYYLSDLLLAVGAPGQAAEPTLSVSVFGDSFAAQSINADVSTPRFDAAINWNLKRRFMADGHVIDYDGVGFGGYTICTNVGSNLDDEWDGFLATYSNKNVLIMAGNNDITAAQDADVTNPTTGTYANLQKWLDDCLDDGRRRVIVTNTGSLKQNVLLDLAAEQARQDLVDDEMNRAIVDWVAANGSSMRVIKLDLWAALYGDLDGNHNYQGYLDVLGNNTVPGAAAEDRHPSAFGHATLTEYIHSAIVC